MSINTLFIGAISFITLTYVAQAEEYRCPSPQTLASRNFLNFVINAGNPKSATLVLEEPYFYTFTCYYQNAKIQDGIAAQECSYKSASKNSHTNSIGECTNWPCEIICDVS